jgi:AcrR family transcriptional regulator
MTDAGTPRDLTRARIVRAAADLLVRSGIDAVTTRAVAEAAGVQAPTIYRLFGDKDGLLEAVAEHTMALFAAEKAAIVEAAQRDDIDPLDDLASGWDAQVEFGLRHPDVIALLSAPARVRESEAARAGRRALEVRIHRLAVAGRLRIEEGRAVDLIQAAGIGVIQSLLSMPPDERDPRLAPVMFEAVLGRILTDVPEAAGGAVAVAVSLRAAAAELPGLTPGERALMGEWLDRAIDAAG